MARAVLSSLRLTAIALAGVGLVSLAVNFFAVKGAWAWGQFADQIPNIRVGATARSGGTCSPSRLEACAPLGAEDMDTLSPRAQVFAVLTGMG